MAQRRQEITSFKVEEGGTQGRNLSQEEVRVKGKGSLFSKGVCFVLSWFLFCFCGRCVEIRLWGLLAKPCVLTIHSPKHCSSPGRATMKPSRKDKSLELANDGCRLRAPGV